MSQRENSQLFSKKQKHFTLNGKEQQDNAIVNDILKGIVELNDVSRFFFSAKNINHLNGLISKKVFLLSNQKYRIGKQNEKELVTIMRHIYLEHAVNQNENVMQQVADLNFRVLTFAVPNVLNNIQNYLGYMKDKGTNVIPSLERPENVNLYGTKSSDNYDIWYV
jgi:hypothetical protein